MEYKIILCDKNNGWGKVNGGYINVLSFSNRSLREEFISRELLNGDNLEEAFAKEPFRAVIVNNVLTITARFSKNSYKTWESLENKNYAITMDRNNQIQCWTVVDIRSISDNGGMWEFVLEQDVFMNYNLEGAFNDTKGLVERAHYRRFLVDAGIDRAKPDLTMGNPNGLPDPLDGSISYTALTTYNKKDLDIDFSNIIDDKLNNTEKKLVNDWLNKQEWLVSFLGEAVGFNDKKGDTASAGYLPEITYTQGKMKNPATGKYETTDIKLFYETTYSFTDAPYDGKLVDFANILAEGNQPLTPANYKISMTPLKPLEMWDDGGEVYTDKGETPPLELKWSSIVGQMIKKEDGSKYVIPVNYRATASMQNVAISTSPEAIGRCISPYPLISNLARFTEGMGYFSYEFYDPDFPQAGKKICFKNRDRKGNPITPKGSTISEPNTQVNLVGNRITYLTGGEGVKPEFQAEKWYYWANFDVYNANVVLQTPPFELVPTFSKAKETVLNINLPFKPEWEAKMWTSPYHRWLIQNANSDFAVVPQWLDNQDCYFEINVNLSPSFNHTTVAPKTKTGIYSDPYYNKQYFQDVSNGMLATSKNEEREYRVRNGAMYDSQLRQQARMAGQARTMGYFNVAAGILSLGTGLMGYAKGFGGMKQAMGMSGWRRQMMVDRSSRTLLRSASEGNSGGSQIMSGVYEYENSMFGVERMIAQQNDLMNSPNAYVGATNDVMFNITHNMVKPMLVEYILQDHFYQSVATQFHKFGVNYPAELRTIKDVCFNRYYFNFIKTADVLPCLTAELPKPVKNEIAFALDNGVRIWHYRDSKTWKGIGNYDVNNVEMEYLEVK